MISEWFTGLNDQEKKDVRVNFKEALVMRKRLKDMISSKTSSSWKNSITKLGYESPSWALKQADARGYERAMSEIEKIISD